MGQLYVSEEPIEKVILIGVKLNDGDDTERSLAELKELAATAGAVTSGILIQNRDSVHPGTYIGKGKIDEVKEMAEQQGATGVICDDELSPAQLKNLENALQIKVMDRTMLILDIFASRATTKEGKIQVELAQLHYRATRLVGMRNSLSRLGGGIGTKGPGEKKLEMDRRLIRDRISQLNKELADVKRNREVTRQMRSKTGIPVVAIVGYTNAGKSTLLNYLTNAEILAEDKLFATLDPTTRNYELESGQQILLTDTVGFIRKLPHHLIDAFRSTLEEAKYSDIILHIVDASNSEADQQMHVVYSTLKKLGIQDKTVITVFNKQDLVEGDQIQKDLQAEATVKISAYTGEGLPELMQIVEKILRDRKTYVEKVLSFDEAGKIQIIRKYGQLITEEYREDGIFIQAYIPSEIHL